MKLYGKLNAPSPQFKHNPINMKLQNTLKTLSLMTVAIGGMLPLSLLHAQEPRTPVIIEGKETLPLRVLTRPFSSVYAGADTAAAIVEENLPAFQPLYVYTKPAANDFGDEDQWYEVGRNDQGNVIGWMKAADVMEWKQAMCLAYTHPEGRTPVMMFAQHDKLADVLVGDADARIAKVDSLLSTLQSGTIPADFPLLSMEPKRAVFMYIEDQFYLLPILQHEAVVIDGMEGRLMQIAAATTAAGGRGATTLKDEQFVQNVVAATEGNSATLKDLKLEVVYVIDTSASMQPYIDATRAAIRKVVNQVAGDPQVAENIKFGGWAFRDSLDIQGIEYLTTNFSGDLLNAAAFADVLDQVKEAPVGSQGFPEDVFSGIDEALRKTNWSDDTLKMIFLIGDAPSHPKGHQWNASGKGAEELNQYAKDSRISITAVHILDEQDPRKEEYNQQAVEQFSALSYNRGADATGESSYFAVPANDPVQFESDMDDVLNVLIPLVKSAREQGDVSEIVALETPDDFANDVDTHAAPATQTQAVTAVPAAEEESEATRVTKNMVKAALVDWIGKEEGVKPPRDIVAWVTDKDIKDPYVPALEVRVLLTKYQLDTLQMVLQELMLAGRSGQENSTGFFEALQATTATLAVTPEQIMNARSLADTGLIPEFLQDLPYDSRIMSMTNQDWNDASQDWQDEFLNDLDAKISYYRNLHDSPDMWVRLNEGDDPDVYVHPVSLEMLP